MSSMAAWWYPFSTKTPRAASSSWARSERGSRCPRCIGAARAVASGAARSACRRTWNLLLQLGHRALSGAGRRRSDDDVVLTIPTSTVVACPSNHWSRRVDAVGKGGHSLRQARPHPGRGPRGPGATRRREGPRRRRRRARLAALLYLAAAGVGTIGVVDADVVELTNLHRQVIHSDADLGRLKTESAESAVHRVNPHVEVIRHDVTLDFEQRPRRHPRLRRRRHRQLPDALPRQRRLRPVGQAARLGLDPPLRRSGVGVVEGARAVLSVRLPGAAAARLRPELRRGGVFESFVRQLDPSSPPRPSAAARDRRAADRSSPHP